MSCPQSPSFIGMCTDLHNTDKMEFPREVQAGALDLNKIPEEVGAFDLNKIPEEVGALDLNKIPEEAGALDLNEIPEEADALDLQDAIDFEA